MANVIYFYYAYVEGGVCIDVERTRTKKTDMANYIEITAEQYIASYDGEEESEHYIIGKSWNGSEWYVDDGIYYAIINEKFICVNFAVLSEETDDKSYVKITKSDYENLTCLGKKYDAVSDTFYEVTFPQRADADTTTISVNGSDATLQEVIDALQVAINDKESSVDLESIVEMLKSNDGANSGLDADFLDGHNSDYFATKDDIANNVKVEQLAEYAKVSQLNSYATKGELNGYAAKSELNNCATKAELKNYATTKSVNDKVNTLTTQNSNLATQVGNISKAIESMNGKVPTIEVGNIYKSSSFRGAHEIELGFRPNAVFIFPLDGICYDFEENIKRAGLYIDEDEDTSKQGCCIVDNGFVLYSYEEDGIDLASGKRAYIAIKLE